MEVVGKIDEKGRVTIPKEMRDKAGLRGLVRLRLEGGRVIIEPIAERPIERARFRLTSLDVPKLRRELTEIAEELAGGSG